MANLYRIAIFHSQPIKPGAKGIIFFVDTRTNTQGFIQCVNTTPNNLTPNQWKEFFVANATFSNVDFYTSTNPLNANFQFYGNFPYLEFTNYRYFERSILGIFVEVLTGFNFVIRTIVQPPVVDDNILPLDIRTPIDNDSKVKFSRSPIFLREDMGVNDRRVEVKLYVWAGDLLLPISLPNYVLRKDKISESDSYVSIEISDLIRPFITPNFAYNRLFPPAINGQGVFFQAKIKKYDVENNYTERITPTYFSTLGYLYNYEQSAVNYEMLEPTSKYFNTKIHDYFYQNFDFTKTIEEATSSNVIKYNPIVPTDLTRCSPDSVLIVFLNKKGLWDVFTSFGKVVISTDSERTTSRISHRDPSNVDNSYKHSMDINSIDVIQKYVINTGSLLQEMTPIIEEIIYSKKIYLILFKGDLEETLTEGITIDNTYITIDNDIVTIDAQTVTVENLGFYKSFRQVPVVIEDEDFTLKNRRNDKFNIDYNLTFTETNSKINNIR